jgi:hypothetical protein
MRLTQLRGRIAAWVVVVSCAASSCGSTGPGGTLLGSTPMPVKSGQWGGPHIAMTVASSKTDIEFDCGKATIGGPIDADRDGAFAVTGTFMPERPGPTTPDAPPSRPMRMTGSVKGDDMHVTIVLTDKDETIGDFTLTFGTVARLTKCR